MIFHANNPEMNAIVPELAAILDHFLLYEDEPAGPVPDILLTHASCGSSFGGESPRLTLKQLFAAWRAGWLTHSCYYDADGSTRISEKLYVVGTGYGLSGAYVFWGIVPSRRTIVIADRCPTAEVFSISTSMNIYKRAAEGTLPENALGWVKL